MAIVNKIIHSSVVDGPGNRAAVFLQKCNFKCSYCHNPETIGQCVQCGACVEKCPAKALSLKDGKIVWDAVSYTHLDVYKRRFVWVRCWNIHM